MENTTQLTGIERIKAERERQITEEGYTLVHDEFYDGLELASAAQAYHKAAEYELQSGTPRLEPPQIWPWKADWWKPQGGPARLLEKAGALWLAAADHAERRGVYASHAPIHREEAEKLGKMIDEIESSWCEGCDASTYGKEVHFDPAGVKLCAACKLALDETPRLSREEWIEQAAEHLSRRCDGKPLAEVSAETAKQSRDWATGLYESDMLSEYPNDPRGAVDDELSNS